MTTLNEFSDNSYPDKEGNHSTNLPRGAFDLVENVETALFGLDRFWKFTYVNRQAEKLFGTDKESLIGKNIWEAFPYLADTSIGNMYIKVMETRQYARIEDFYPLRQQWFEVHINPHQEGLAIYFGDITMRKQYETELKESESRFRFFSGATTEGIVILDNGKIIDANLSLAEMFGYSQSEIIGRSVLEFAPSKTHDLIRQKIGGRSESSFELEGLKKDGTLLPLEVEGRSLEYRGRQVRVVILRNLEEKKAAEKGLKESEERFKFLSSVATEGVLVRSDDIIIDANQALANMFGYSLEELFGMPSRKLVTSESLEQLQNQIKEAESSFSTESPEDFIGPFEGIGVRRDGYTFPFETRGRIMEYKGLPLRVSLLRDLRERKTAEEKLRESEERFRILEEASFEGILVHNQNKILEANQRLAGMFGYSLSEIIETPFLQLIAPESRPLVERKIKEGFTGYYEAKGLRKDGTIFLFETQGRFIKFNGKQYRVKTIRDITERIQAQELLERTQAQLQQAQRMESIGQLAGGIAHDFNNLLTAIIGYGELATMRLQPGDEVCKDIDEILKAAMRAASLTHQLLAFSRKQLLQPRVINLNNSVKDMDSLLQRLIGEDIELVSSLDPDLGLTLIDPGQFEQVIMNLAVNARDAMPKGGKLTIETANIELDGSYQSQHGLKLVSGRYVMLAVSDNGTGMAEEIRSKIFDPFFTTKEVGKGTGLGLATVYGIVSQSGGYIFVYSEIGIGTSFKIYLPLYISELEGKDKKLLPVVAANDFSAVKEQSASLRGEETILVVEDDEAVRNLIIRSLEEYGYRLLIAGNGEEALALIENYNGPIHLIVSDIVMPGLGGRELAVQLEQKGVKFKMICMSGYTDRVVSRHNILPEFQNFLQKPFTPTNLVTKVRETLNGVG